MAVITAIRVLQLERGMDAVDIIVDSADDVDLKDLCRWRLP